ncbi:hypothetical protein Leryth_018196 [Lithospermum erythrorhizon]|nr:hypothetical protein Leryth_018196 [Lithospermum erythrorhizon]
MPFQREDSGAEMVHDKRYMVKTFKPESERKKLELPAEKNLLTNYFCIPLLFICFDGRNYPSETSWLYPDHSNFFVLISLTSEGFASREAKRNFRTPRGTPPETGSKNGSSSDKVDLTVEASSTKLNRSSSELFDSRDSFDVDPPVNHDESGRTAQGSGFLNSSGQGTCEKNYDIDGAGVRHSLLHNRIHKPCIMLQKERSSHTSEVKMKLQNGDVVVRSSYFLHKYVKKSDQGNESNGQHEHAYVAEVNNSAPYRSDVQLAQRDDSGKGSEHSHLEEALVKDDVTPFKKYSYMPVSSSNESRLKSSNRKICASAYFKENSMKRNTQECEILDIPDFISESYDRHIHEDSNPSGCYPIEAAEKKRKTAPGDTSHTNDDPSLRGASLHIESNYTPEKNSSSADMKADEGKFGCNISHIGQYSDVAEKSMQKFISTISSYRYTSSGSRASGLRAPLKEIRNTTTEKR